jgi:hypothetical protein
MPCPDLSLKLNSLLPAHKKNKNARLRLVILTPRLFTSSPRQTADKYSRFGLKLFIMGREEESLRLKVLASHLLRDNPQDHIIAILDLLLLIAGLPLKYYPESRVVSSLDAPVVERDLDLSFDHAFSSSSSESDEPDQDIPVCKTPRLLFPLHVLNSTLPLLKTDRVFPTTLVANSSGINVI